MKKNYSLFILLSFFVLPLLAQNKSELKPKLSTLTKKYLHDLQVSKKKNEAPAGYLYKKSNTGQVYISALIKVSNAVQAEQQLKLIGAKVGTKAGNIWTVQVPYNKALEFTQIPGISYIQLDEPVAPKLDVARKTTRVDSVQNGINLPLKYSGKGVIVGVIDFGFDYNHPTFYDTLHAKYRIKRV